MGSEMNLDKYKGFTPEAREIAAGELREGIRGNWLLGKALYYAIEELKKRERPEWSDICDMMLLREEFYDLYRPSDCKRTNES